MTDSELNKIIHLCDLITLKSKAMKEKLSCCQQLEDSEISFSLALFCREMRILNRQIEQIEEENRC